MEKTNFLQLAQERYTTKAYDAGKRISTEQIEELKEILRLSPSSINSQPWKFTFVSNQQIKEQLAKVSYHNDARVLDCSHVVVFSVIDDLEAFETHIKENLPSRMHDYFTANLKPQPEEKTFSWMSRQVYISLGFFLSACAAMQIDSTPMEGIQTKEYGKVLDMQGYRPLFAVCIGYRAADDANQPQHTPKSRLDQQVVVESLD